MAVVGITDLAALGCVAEVAAFEEDAGDFWVPGEADAAADEATVADFHGAGLGHCLLEAGCEAVAIDSPVVGFWTTDEGGAAVVVHTDEDGAAVAIGTGDAVVEVDEGVI